MGRNPKKADSMLPTSHGERRVNVHVPLPLRRRVDRVVDETGVLLRKLVELSLVEYLDHHYPESAKEKK